MLPRFRYKPWSTLALNQPICNPQPMISRLAGIVYSRAPVGQVILTVIGSALALRMRQIEALIIHPDQPRNQKETFWLIAFAVASLITEESASQESAGLGTTVGA